MKIEPGVLAVIVHTSRPENSGRIVTVKEFDPVFTEQFGEPWWRIECPTPLRCQDGTYSTTDCYVAECCLLPISGPSITHKVRLWDELPREVIA